MDGNFQKSSVFYILLMLRAGQITNLEIKRGIKKDGPK
ncbi:hypothetical protein HDF26_002786 [Pedobacter cryoconitis]|nr:hypothetical protein [Pedobacter cryoconitis]